MWDFSINFGHLSMSYSGRIGAFVCRDKSGEHCDNVCISDAWLEVSHNFQRFVLKTFTLWLLRLAACIIKKGNERDPLPLRKSGRLESQSLCLSVILQGAEKLCNFRKRARKASLIMRYRTEVVRGYSASAAQETLLLSGAGKGSDGLCWNFLWMEICLNNIKCSESAQVMRLYTCFVILKYIRIKVWPCWIVNKLSGFSKLQDPSSFINYRIILKSIHDAAVLWSSFSTLNWIKTLSSLPFWSPKLI